jgi:tight adherence protein C
MMEAESIALFQNVGYGLVALLAAATIYTIASPFFQTDKLKRRMDSVASAREGMRKNRMDQLNRRRNFAQTIAA